jgi:sulfur-oxidizing protein SoxY
LIEHEQSVGQRMTTPRRTLIKATLAAVSAATLPLHPGRAAAQTLSRTTLGAKMDRAVQAFTGGADIATGGVRFQVAALVENGNTVPVEVEVDSPMQPNNFVRRIAVFNQSNPQADMVVFELTPLLGRAKVATRLRLSTSQTLWAVAQMSDGQFRGATADVIVTLAACVEDTTLTP